jgi:hypothetical protein
VGIVFWEGGIGLGKDGERKGLLALNTREEGQATAGDRELSILEEHNRPIDSGKKGL